VGLLLALSNGEKANKSPPRETDSNSNSAQSSPETHLSSACLLVQAAVEPMEQGFKFPKTKKVLMNEWLNKVPEPVHSASSISPSSLTPHINTSTDYDSNVGFYTPGKSLVALAQVASFCDTNVQPRGNAKKRWLRQAISEDQCDSPSGRPGTLFRWL
jgi:histone-lysine N-methyltransferase MLL5